MAAVMRLGLDEIGVTELMAVTEHSRAMATAAAGILLESLDSDRALVPPVDPGSTDRSVRGLLEEIAASIGKSMGRQTIPAIWRVFAHDPQYLESTWRKELVVMGAGSLSAHDKRRTALGVAMTVRSRYMIEYHAAIVSRLGDSDRDILEILGVVDHYTTLNTLSEGMQIESDIRPQA